MLLGSVFLAGWMGSGAIAGEGSPDPLARCDIQSGPCTQVRDALTVTMDIFPKPVRAMKELTFRLILGGVEMTGIPHIDLSMPGMAMGPNRVRMKCVGVNTYEGRGVVVKCPSGRRTWKALVTLPDGRAVDFVFDVIY